MEDTYNLVGHALRTALGVLARQQGRELADVATAAGAPVLAGPSLKAALDRDWERQVLTALTALTCPHGAGMPVVPGGTAHFPTTPCQTCPRRARCTARPRGRSVSSHRDERLLHERRARQQTTAGRAARRARGHVEPSRAHSGAWPGARARYRGHRKQLFDPRRTAAVETLPIIQRFPTDAAVPRAA